MADNTITTKEATAWLKESSRYFANRPTDGEDKAHWANVANSETVLKIAALIDEQQRLATMGAFWLTLLIDRVDIDPEATVINVTARNADGSRRELTQLSLADAMKQFKDAGIDAGSLAGGLG